MSSTWPCCSPSPTYATITLLHHTHISTHTISHPLAFETDKVLSYQTHCHPLGSFQQALLNQVNVIPGATMRATPHRSVWGGGVRTEPHLQDLQQQPVTMLVVLCEEVSAKVNVSAVIACLTDNLRQDKRPTGIPKHCLFCKLTHPNQFEQVSSVERRNHPCPSAHKPHSIALPELGHLMLCGRV